MGWVRMRVDKIQVNARPEPKNGVFCGMAVARARHGLPLKRAQSTEQLCSNELQPSCKELHCAASPAWLHYTLFVSRAWLGRFTYLHKQ